MAYENIVVETREHVGLIRLDRPKAMNALNGALMRELGEALEKFDADDAVGAIVITGSEKAFAAGADIKEMQSKSFVEAYQEDFITAEWETTTRIRKPVIAAVAGFALGGGCELAMMCDFILAADTAKFGQPEINLGVMPGAGGTQRLTRFVGKSKAMEMCLTGRFMEAEEAERAGLVSRIVPADELVDEAVATAGKIASKGRIAVLATKEAVNRAYETTLSEGVRAERRLFHALFATEDQAEGMAAFEAQRHLPGRLDVSSSPRQPPSAPAGAPVDGAGGLVYRHAPFSRRKETDRQHGQHANRQEARAPDRAAHRGQPEAALAHPHLHPQGRGADREGRPRGGAGRAAGGAARADEGRRQGRAPPQHGEPQDLAPAAANQPHLRLKRRVRAGHCRAPAAGAAGGLRACALCGHAWAVLGPCSGRARAVLGARRMFVFPPRGRAAAFWLASCPGEKGAPACNTCRRSRSMSAHAGRGQWANSH